MGDFWETFERQRQRQKSDLDSIRNSCDVLQTIQDLKLCCEAQHMSRNALKDDGKLSKMRQEEPEMLEALEENLADFHGRKEKSSTWWCPILKGSHPERKKETFNFC